MYHNSLFYFQLTLEPVLTTVGMADSAATDQARAPKSKPKVPAPQPKPPLIIPCFRVYDFDTLDEALDYLHKHTST